MPKFRFYIDGELVHPIYNNGMAREWTEYPDQSFYRPELSEPFKIIPPDYNIIHNADIEHEFSFLCEELTDPSVPTWTEFFTGYFTKFDIQENDGDKMIMRVKPLPDDRYRLLLDGWEKELNLVDLNIPKEVVKYKRHSILQIYFEGFNSSKVVNYSGSQIWESVTAERFTETNLAGLTNSGFKSYVDGGGVNQSSNVRDLYVFGVGLSIDVTGRYDLHAVPPTSIEWRDELGVYQVEYFSASDFWFIKRISDGEVLFNNVSAGSPSSNIMPLVAASVLNPGESVQVEGWKIWTRLLTHKESSGAAVMVDLPDDNIVEAFGRTKYRDDAAASFASPLLSLSRVTDVTDQGFGQILTPAIQNVGLYYKQSGATQRIPVLKSLWHDLSLWLTIQSGEQAILDELLETIELADAWRVDKVLKAMINELDPSLLHDVWDDTYSRFFYSIINPLTGLPQQWLYLTAKSNITTPDYDEAATKVPVKLKDYMRALFLIFGVRFDITDGDKMRVEHEEFYERGGTYGAGLVGVDLNTQIEPRVGKYWNYHTSKWAYSKPDVPGYVNIKWRDNVSNIFKGVAVEMVSPYAEKERRDEPVIPLIVTDIDFILNNPSLVSRDGLVLLDVEDIGGELWVKELEMNDPDYGVTVTVQNGELSRTRLDEKYGQYLLPVKTAIINGVSTPAVTVKKTTIQELRMLLKNHLNPIKLVWTALGKGKVKKVQEYMKTGENKITVKHDTEL